MHRSEAPSAFLAAWDAWAARAQAPLSAAAALAARRSWFDTLATTAAGAVENCARAALRACAVDDVRALSAGDAALVLGAASHALDYDDVCMLATCHPSAPADSCTVGAAAAQLAQERPELTLGELLAAYLVGTETVLRLGEVVGLSALRAGLPRHRHAGHRWQCRSSRPCFGAAGRPGPCGLVDPRPAVPAGCAPTSAPTPSRCTWGWPPRPACGPRCWRAPGRMRATMSGGATGFPLAFNGGQLPQALPWRDGTEWAIVQQPGFEHKRYPSCYLTHRMISGILQVGERQDAAARGRPVRIEIEVAHQGLAALKHPPGHDRLAGQVQRALLRCGGLAGWPRGVGLVHRRRCAACRLAGPDARCGAA